MLIKPLDRVEIAEYLERERWYNGAEFMTYLDNGSSNEKEEIVCWQSYDEAVRYCILNSTDVDRYEVLGVRAAYRSLYNGIKGHQEFVYRNGAIDVKAMVTAHQENLTQGELINNKGEKVMEKNQEVFEFLQERLTYMGFGELVDKDKLSKLIASQATEFELKGKAVYPDGIVGVTLYFKKSEESDKYFFNHYDAELKKIGVKETIKQRFFVNSKGGSITLKEAYNMLQGRSVYKSLVNKDGHEYKAWVTLDRNKQNSNGNYELIRSYKFEVADLIPKYNFKEAQYPRSLEGLIKGLERGNQQVVTIVKGKTETKRLVEANPDFKQFVFRSPETGRVVIESQIKVAPEKAQEATQNAAANQQDQKEVKGQNATADKANQQESNVGNIPTAPAKDTANTITSNAKEPAAKEVADLTNSKGVNAGADTKAKVAGVQNKADDAVNKPNQQENNVGNIPTATAKDTANAVTSNAKEPAGKEVADLTNSKAVNAGADTKAEVAGVQNKADDAAKKKVEKQSPTTVRKRTNKRRMSA